MEEQRPHIIDPSAALSYYHRDLMIPIDDQGLTGGPSFFPIDVEDLPLNQVLELNDELLDSLKRVQPRVAAPLPPPRSPEPNPDVVLPLPDESEVSSTLPSSALPNVVSTEQLSPVERPKIVTPERTPVVVCVPNATEAIEAPPQRPRGQRDEEAWNAYYYQLAAYYQQYGHCRIPNVPLFKPLNRWVKRQRYLYKARQAGKKSSLTPRRIESMDRIGFAWYAHEAIWEGRYCELTAYHKEYGNADVPATHENNGLARWVQSQRRLYKLGKLAPTRIERLEELGFSWALKFMSKK